MEILKFPDYRLFEPTSAVTVFGEELETLLEAMWATMLKANGIGLSANQVGLKYSMFTMIGPKDEKLFLVNPKIVKQSTVPCNLTEGCLSAPGEFLVLSERASWVQIEFQDHTGESKSRVFHGIHSVCVQHEIDHLNGKSFLESKSINKVKRKELLKKYGRAK